MIYIVDIAISVKIHDQNKQGQLSTPLRTIGMSFQRGDRSLVDTIDLARAELNAWIEAIKRTEDGEPTPPAGATLRRLGD